MQLPKSMSVPSTVTFRDIPSTPALEELVGHWVTKLELAHPRIEHCVVTIERPHQHQRKGQPIRVCIQVAVPGPNVVVSREHGLDGARFDMYVAIRNAFRAARRQLEEQSRVRYEPIRA